MKINVKNTVLMTTALALFIVTSFAQGASPQNDYRATCSACHDQGIAGAPRLGDASNWAKRIAKGKQALYVSALRGMPGTAMMAKGGAANLSDDDVRGVVDFMISKIPVGSVPFSPATAQPSINYEAENTRLRQELEFSKQKNLEAESQAIQRQSQTMSGQPPPVQAVVPQITDRLSLDASKVKCGELGFKSGTEAFGKCVLQLSK